MKCFTPLLHRWRTELAIVMVVAVCAEPAPVLFAAIIGTNEPAQPVTLERIGGLSFWKRARWKRYLRRSEKQMQADKNYIRAELVQHGITEATNAPSARVFRGIPLRRAADWYSSPQARHIADVVVSFQTPAGGWSKRLDMTSRVRSPGELFTSDNNSRFLTRSDNDMPEDTHWSYVGTFDNNATTTQLRYLAKVITALPADQSEKYRTAFLHGLDYIFASQYPNGGWPQVWPLQGGYHDAITYNDGAMAHILELLQTVADGQNEFAFVPKKERRHATESVKHGIQCVLDTQIIANGRRTVWCQQHDALTLQPTAARNYEMPCEASAESAEIMTFLMNQPHPSKQIVVAIDSAAAWFEKTRIMGFAFRFNGPAGRQLVAEPGYGPIWARYYQIGTDRPIFGDRDKTIHDRVDEISAERRRGYAWYGNSAEAALEQYKAWRKEHSEK